MTEQSEKVMGIIRNPGYGCRDFDGRYGGVGLWFEVYTSESIASLQCFFGEQATEIIREFGVYDVKDLHGKPCWVRDAGGLVKFVGPCVI